LNIPPVERKIRASFPVIRLMQGFIPLPLSRWFIRRSLAQAQMHAGVTRQAVSAEVVPCQWVISPDSQGERALLYLHGGGFVFGLTHLHLQLGAALAQKLGMRVLMVDYRLAPDHPFPAALDDCLAAYRWLLDQGILPQNIVVAGDSAGGNLTLTTLLKLHQCGDPLPAAAACLSPVTDLTAKGHQRQGFKDPLLPSKATKFYSQSYTGNHDPHDPLISPVYGDLHGLPPLLVHVGEEEILREDAIRITDSARAAGVDVRLEIFPRMWHVWQLFLDLPQATQSLDDIAGFFEAHLTSPIQDPGQPGSANPLNR
jgi:acetyl esterase/lipase